MVNKPIFIIGCPRSGTTLVRVILDSHPSICCGPETHILKHMKNLREKIDEHWKMLKPYGIDEKAIDSKVGEILTVFTDNYIKIKNKKRWAEKTPENIFYVDSINRFFPDCQFINVIRDGRDVVSSFKRRWGRKAVLSAIKYWNQSIDLSYKYAKQFPRERYLEIRYEDLVTKTEEVTRKIMDFLNEEWLPVLLQHQKSEHDFWFDNNKEPDIDKKSEKNPTRHSPSKPVFSSSVGTWKKDLNIIEKALINLLMKDNLKKLNYL